jgi:hypothetical protein
VRARRTPHSPIPNAPPTTAPIAMTASVIPRR